MQPCVFLVTVLVLQVAGVVVRLGWCCLLLERRAATAQHSELTHSYLTLRVVSPCAAAFNE